MVKGVKRVEKAEGDYMVVRVIIPKSTYKALKVKCALMDISVKEGMIDMIEKWVKDTKKAIANMKKNG
ncbi:hypothetical protein ES703_44211 [subsurface metagenome]